MATNNKKSGHVYELNETTSVFLNLFRVILAQMVVFGHGMSFFNIFAYFRYPYAPDIQNVAVVIFFLLSGYLIAYTVTRKSLKKRYNFNEYFFDRFLRIYTGYLPAILFVIAVDTLHIYINSATYTHRNALNLQTLIGNLFMLQDYPFGTIITENIRNINFGIFAVTSFGSARPFWTIAIEWWIYMSFGWFVLNHQFKKNHRLIAIIIGMFFAVVPVLNIVGGRGTGLTMVWLMGLVVYLGSSTKSIGFLSLRSSYFASILFLLLGLKRVMQTKDAYDILFSALIAWSFLFFLRGTQISSFKFPPRLTRIINFMADYSFMLYLTHYSLQEILLIWKSQFSPYYLFTVSIIISNIIAGMLAYFTEMKRHLLSFKLKTLLISKYGSRLIYQLEN